MTHCCDGTCDQGRRCPHSLDATRCALWLAPLHQNDGEILRANFDEGGESVRGRMRFPSNPRQAPGMPTPTRRGGLLAALRKLIKL